MAGTMAFSWLRFNRFRESEKSRGGGGGGGETREPAMK